MINVLRKGMAGVFATIETPSDLFLLPDYDELKDDLTLDTVTTAAWVVDKINKVHAVTLRHATGDKESEDRDTWQPKALAAAAHIAGVATASQAAGLQDEADRTGSTVDILAALIMSKSDAYTGILFKASGIRRAATAAVIAAATADEALAIFEQAKTDFVEMEV